VKQATVTQERPILFSSQMVRAILAGKKTQTRRLVKPQPFFSHNHDCYMLAKGRGKYEMNSRRKVTYEDGKPVSVEDYLVPLDEWLLEKSPFTVGEILWVRENLALGEEDFTYKADGAEVVVPDGLKWGHSVGTISCIHMPRWAARIFLEVTAVRVQRLLDISEDDAVEEGAGPDVLIDRENDPYNYGGQRTNRHGFLNLWNDLHGDNAWRANPFVHAVTFRRAAI